MRDQKGGIWDQSPRIRDQQFFEGSGIWLYHFCKIRDQTFSCFWNQGSEIWVQKWIGDEKNIPRDDPASLALHCITIKCDEEEAQPLSAAGFCIGKVPKPELF